MRVHARIVPFRQPALGTIWASAGFFVLLVALIRAKREIRAILRTMDAQLLRRLDPSYMW